MLTLATLVLVAVTHGHDERLKDENGDYIHRGCATEEHNEELLANDPEWRESLANFEIEWAARSKAIQSGEDKVKKADLNVPIIWHIVMQNPNQVSDVAIAYQLNVLNADFSATNSDYTSGTPAEFRDPDVRSGDTGIRYATNTVERVVTSVSSFSTNDNIKRAANGGSNVISPESNLNYWVGVLSGGVLGYAQFPGGSSSTDGIVCAPGTLSPDIGSYPYNLGRTATHEIGHWLNLRHIWGDNSGCTNTLLISDFVTDTPPSSSSNFGCPSGTKKCSANTFTQDMYMNYMDYVYDECMVMFTQLQLARAETSIDQYRGGFNSAQKSRDEYVNWLYFNRFDEEQSENKCFGEDILFYENNLNENSDSNVYIYGCMMKTNVMSVSHMTDITFITGDNSDIECGDGYYRASQDLNEGNDGYIYMCYNKIESNEDNENMAILDITFIADDDTTKLDLNEWEINMDMDLNPNGVKLNFAMKKGQYFDEITEKDTVSNGNPISGAVEEKGVYVGVGVGLFLFAAVLIGMVFWRYVCSRKGFKAYMNESLTNEYGATTELTNRL